MEKSVDLHEVASKENEQTLENLSPVQEAKSKDEVEIEKFLQEQKSKNTQYKTKSNLNAWKKFCESQKESRAMKNIPADLLLSKFFISVRKQNGTLIEWLNCRTKTEHQKLPDLKINIDSLISILLLQNEMNLVSCSGTLSEIGATSTLDNSSP